MWQGLARAWMTSMVVMGLLVAGCGSSATDPRDGFTEPDAANFRSMERVAAFHAAHQKFSAEYGLTQWKGIDWADLKRRHLPKIEQAAAANDPRAYFLAVREYLFEIDDGHVFVRQDRDNGALIDGLIAQQSGGGYGIGLAELDDGTVIAARVVDGGAAAAAGMVAGARIERWNGVPIAAAIDAVRLGRLAAASHFAVSAHQRLEKARLLARAAIGSAVVVEFRNPGAAQSKAATLTAVDDQLAGLHLVDFARPPSAEDDKAAILWESDTAKHGGYGYIRLNALAYADPAKSPEGIWIELQKAIAQYNDADVPGLILDLRVNRGGLDILGALICGAFVSAPTLYEIALVYDKRSGEFVNVSRSPETGKYAEATMAIPQDVQFRRPVAVLVTPRALSSAEGPAKCINDLPRGAVVGFHGTRGSFALAGGEILLPDGVNIHYPYGRAVDARGIVLIDSRHGVGGVEPKARIAKTYDNVMAYARGEDVERDQAIGWLNQQRK